MDDDLILPETQLHLVPLDGKMHVASDECCCGPRLQEDADENDSPEAQAVQVWEHRWFGEG